MFIVNETWKEEAMSGIDTREEMNNKTKVVKSENSIIIGQVK